MSKGSCHFPLLLPAASVVCIFMASCSQEAAPTGKAGGGGGPAPVVVAESVEKDMPVELLAIGNVRAMATVAVKPRVSGQIDKVHFREGQDVNEGDVLVTLDPAPFQVALNKAEAQLAQARTQAQIAATQAGRYNSLVTKGAVAQEEVDQLRSVADSAKSNENAADAVVKEAQLQLDYCTIRSPISGRAGRRAVDAGNVVRADESDLVVVNQVKPVEVIFSVPEQYFSDITRYSAKGQLKVSIKPNGGEARDISGFLTFVDNAVKLTTGTLEVKATMPNEDLALWPGQFGEIRLTLTTQTDAIVIPGSAVQTGQNGQYVFVIKPDETAEVRPVEVDRTIGVEAIIRNGLKAGEQVVVDGQMRLAPGVRVSIKPPVGAAPPVPKQPAVAEGKLP